MICSRCKKEKSYFDMQPMTENDSNGHPITPKPLVCHECLGWQKPKVAFDPNNFTFKRGII
jgi:hypothetical protein